MSPEFSKYFLIFERKKSNLILKFSCDFNLVHNCKPAELRQVVPIQAQLIYNFHECEVLKFELGLTREGKFFVRARAHLLCKPST